jgi:DNA polymerase-3 subunit delta
MKTIAEHIKQHNLKHVYLLYGNEQQVVKIYRNKLLTELLGTDSLETLKQDMNFSLFIGTPIDLGEVINIASSYPFLAEKRVILLENTKVFSKDSSKLAEFIKDIPETTYMIFTEISISDKKGLYKAIEEVGYATEIKEQPIEFVEKWIIRTLSDADKRISRAAIEALIARTGNDMMRINNELDKLIAYKGEESDIKLDDITALVTQDPQDQVFKMIDAMAAKNLDLAMKYYMDLLELKVPPSKIISLVERHMRILIQVKDMREKGFPASAIAERIKEVKSFAANKYVSQATKFKTVEIMDCLKDCVDLTLQSRTGALTDRMAAELIITKYSSKQKS